MHIYLIYANTMYINNIQCLTEVYFLKNQHIYAMQLQALLVWGLVKK